MKTWPIWVKKLITDFIETGLAAVLALSFVVPVTLEASKTVAILFAAAIAGALVAAVRRAVPPALIWFKGVLGITTE
jgi:hypothetical protein